MDKWDAYDLSSFGLYLSKKYPFKVEIPYDGTQLKSSNIALFLTKFNEFYKNCKAENFIKKHNSDFNKITGYAEKAIIESDVLNVVEKFYNKPSTGEILIFANILNNIGNNAIEIKDPKYENKKIFKVAYLNDKKGFQTIETIVKLIPLSNVVTHEISHLFFNDFIPKNRERLSIKKKLFLTTAKNEILNDSEWENEREELLVRVCVSKILLEKFGTEIESKEIENQSKRYKYFKDLNIFFNIYTKNRTKYKSITEFYLEILHFIETLQ